MSGTVHASFEMFPVL